jgi:hypothetical protein
MVVVEWEYVWNTGGAILPRSGDRQRGRLRLRLDSAVARLFSLT